MAVSQYARDNEITGNDFQIFMQLMSAIDAEWLKHVADEAKARKEAEKR